MFWKRKKEEPEVLDIASLINEGDQQGKVYTSMYGQLVEAGKMDKNGDIFQANAFTELVACSGKIVHYNTNIEIPYSACSG